MSRSTGDRRERQVGALLRADGWVAYVTRNACVDDPDLVTSKGAVDVIAVRFAPTASVVVRFIQVKTTAQGPFERFGPAARARFERECELAGAEGELWWWPPRQLPRVIPLSEWPRRQRAAVT